MFENINPVILIIIAVAVVVIIAILMSRGGRGFVEEERAVFSLNRGIITNMILDDLWTSNDVVITNKRIYFSSHFGFFLLYYLFSRFTVITVGFASGPMNIPVQNASLGRMRTFIRTALAVKETLKQEKIDKIVTGINEDAKFEISE